MSIFDYPDRKSKPRATGLSILIDNGYPTDYFEDVINSFSDYIDFVKFGWGTSVVTKYISQKIEFLKKQEIDYFFGGTLFEKAVHQSKMDGFYNYLKKHECKFVEVSNGTIEMSNTEKGKYIRDFAGEFTVFSEVGLKDQQRSLEMHPKLWVEAILEDLENGAHKVITEARESGTSGICRSDGEIRFGLVEEILDSGIKIEDIIFEAPNKQLQVFFIKKIGVNCNLANIAFSDVIPLETLRLGLRSDTLIEIN